MALSSDICLVTWRARLYFQLVVSWRERHFVLQFSSGGSSIGVLGANAFSDTINGLKENTPLALNPLFIFPRVIDFSLVGVKTSAKFKLEISCFSLCLVKLKKACWSQKILKLREKSLSNELFIWPAVATLTTVLISQKNKIIKIFANVHKIITPL